MTSENKSQSTLQSVKSNSNTSTTDLKISSILNLDSYCQLCVEQFRSAFANANQEYRQVFDIIVSNTTNSLQTDIKSMATIEHKIISYWWEQSNIEIKANTTKDTQSNQNYYYPNNGIPQNQKNQKGKTADSYSIISLYNILISEFPQFVELVRIKTYSISKMKEFITIPNDQEKRLYHINQGDKYLQSALYGTDDNELYTDALSEYTKALNYESNDYYSLNKCGYIYLKSDKNKNYAKAESCFRSAVKYLIAEARAKELDKEKQEELLSEAAYALLYAAEACSAQDKKSEAMKLAVEAWKCRINYTQAGLFLAKCILDSNVKDSVIFIDNLINDNKYFSIRILLDKELISRKEIQQSILSKKDELLKLISKQISEIEQHIIENSQAKDKFNRAKALYKFNTYLQLREALDILEEKCEWIIPRAVNYDTNGNITAKTNNKRLSMSAIEFVKQENKVFYDLQLLGMLNVYYSLKAKMSNIWPPTKYDINSNLGFKNFDNGLSDIYNNHNFDIYDLLEKEAENKSNRSIVDENIRFSLYDIPILYTNLDEVMKNININKEKIRKLSNEKVKKILILVLSAFSMYFLTMSIPLYSTLAKVGKLLVVLLLFMYLVFKAYYLKIKYSVRSEQDEINRAEIWLEREPASKLIREEFENLKVEINNYFKMRFKRKLVSSDIEYFIRLKNTGVLDF